MNDLNQAPQQQSGEDLSLLLKIVSFLLPIVGAILYFVYRNEAPRKAKSACNFALIGFVVGIVLNIIARMM